MQPDSTFRKQVDKIQESGIVVEGVKDLKTIAGEVIKGVRGKPEEDVTETDRQKLDDLFKKELGVKVPKAVENRPREDK